MTALPRITGGILLQRYKPGLDTPIVNIPLPDRLVYPLIGHRGKVVQCTAAVGQDVQAGRLLAEGIVASADGRVHSIEAQPAAHPSGVLVPSIRLDVAATQTALSGSVTPLSIDALYASGVTGHGGAGFGTANKLAQVEGNCQTLVINAAECEPGIACDEALLLHDTEACLQAIGTVIEWLQPRSAVIAIENDKTQAIESLARLSQARVLHIQAVYPSGAERALVNLVLHHQQQPALSTEERPTDRGVVCLNLATVHAMGRVAQGKPVIHRLVSVDGAQPCHARVPFGTPLRHVLEVTGNLPRGKQRVRIGGALSGYDIDNLDTPIATTVNAIAVTDPQPRPAEFACIRCGDCIPVCPSGLLPHLLLEQARAADARQLERQGIDACITCGCCDIVCPSRIPLTAHFRQAQFDRNQAHTADSEAARADTLYARHQARLARDAQRPPAPEQSAVQDDVAAVLARARKRRRP